MFRYFGKKKMQKLNSVPRNILVVNQPLNNRGDESAHKALIRSILHSLPKANICVLFVDRVQENVDQFVVHDARVSYINIHSKRGWRRSLWLAIEYNFWVFSKIHPTARKIIDLYNESDIILCAPGGICMGGFQNWDHILMLAIAKSLKKIIAYYGRSIGPFPLKNKENKRFKDISLSLLSYFSFLSLRDNKSMNLADSLNIKYEPTVDSAFLETPKVEVSHNLLNQIGSKPYVVFVPNLLIWHYAYKDKASLSDVLEFYKKILDCIVAKYPEHSVVMLPQTFYFDNKNKGDVNFFRELKQYTQCDKMIILPDIYSSDLQQTIISKADCMIGARYHSVVFAINQAIPFVALSYEHKISGLLETLHKTESMVDITTAFDTDENMQNIFGQFCRALNVVNVDVNAQITAKKMARACFDKFVLFCTNCLTIDES